MFAWTFTEKYYEQESQPVKEILTDWNKFQFFVQRALDKHLHVIK